MHYTNGKKSTLKTTIDGIQHNEQIYEILFDQLADFFSIALLSVRHTNANYNI